MLIVRYAHEGHEMIRREVATRSVLILFFRDCRNCGLLFRLLSIAGDQSLFIDGLGIVLMNERCYM